MVRDSITNSTDSSEVTAPMNATSTCTYEVCMSSPADTATLSAQLGSALLTRSGGLDWIITTNGTDFYNAKINFTSNNIRPSINDDHTAVANFLNISNISINADPDPSAPEDTFSIIVMQEKGVTTVNTTSIESVPMTIHLDVERGKVTYGKTVQTITMYLESNGKVYSDNVQITGYGLEPLDHIKEKTLGGSILGGIIELRFDRPYYDEGLERIAELEGEGYSIESLTSEATSDWHDHPTTAYVVILKHRNEPSP